MTVHIGLLKSCYYFIFNLSNFTECTWICICEILWAHTLVDKVDRILNCICLGSRRELKMKQTTLSSSNFHWLSLSKLECNTGWFCFRLWCQFITLSGQTTMFQRPCPSFHGLGIDCMSTESILLYNLARGGLHHLQQGLQDHWKVFASFLS